MACSTDGTGADPAGCRAGEGAAVIAADPDAGVSILGFSAVVGIGAGASGRFRKRTRIR
jgi:hypothetical protein